MMGTSIVVIGLVAVVVWQQIKIHEIARTLSVSVIISEKLSNRQTAVEEQTIEFSKAVQKSISTLEDNVQVLALGMKGSVDAIMVQSNEITKINTSLKESN